MLTSRSESPFDSYEHVGRSTDNPPACVDVYPRDAATRHRVNWNGMAAEIVQAIQYNRVTFGYRGGRHLLAVCEHGVRNDGETIVEGLPRSRLRDVTRKLTVVPAGHSYSDWHEPRILSRMLYFYFDAARLPAPGLAPRLLFENPTLFDMATRLTRSFETSVSGTPYFEALGTVLAHEVLDLDTEHAGAGNPLKGGLAPWQQREATAYIKGHLSEPIRLATLARLVGLSPYHFCRAFKQSLGLPPHQYHCQRRIDLAKHLLVSTRASVTEIGLTVGYSETSSFTAAFHRTTGMTPTAFRRSLAGPLISDHIA
jgi:AraC family transcriptional regulator